MDYEKETRQAYRNVLRANEYKKHLTEELSWARFTTLREQRCVSKALGQCHLQAGDKILDVPCGTGVLKNVLKGSPSFIFACDISREMMNLAKEEYQGKPFSGFAEADVTRMPFTHKTFACVITLGFMHRVPLEIRKKTLREITSISKKFIIVSYSIDSKTQRFKKWIIKKIRPTYIPAPSPSSSQDITDEFRSQGLTVKKIFKTANFLSSDTIFLLQKK